MTTHFTEADLAGLWMDAEYSTQNYVEDAPSDALVAEVERALGVTLPAAYVELARRSQNGGLVAHERGSHAATGTTWAADHVAINGILAIGRTRRYSLLGDAGSQFWVDHWAYPPIGVYFADCPSAGHDMFALDYRACGPTGEPAVVHVDQERDYAITHLADDFAAFVRGLVSSERFGG